MQFLFLGEISIQEQEGERKKGEEEGKEEMKCGERCAGVFRAQLNMKALKERERREEASREAEATFHRNLAKENEAAFEEEMRREKEELEALLVGKMESHRAKEEGMAKAEGG